MSPRATSVGALRLCDNSSRVKQPTQPHLYFERMGVTKGPLLVSERQSQQTCECVWLGTSEAFHTITANNLLPLRRLELRNCYRTCKCHRIRRVTIRSYILSLSSSRHHCPILVYIQTCRLERSLAVPCTIPQACETRRRLLGTTGLAAVRSS